ncbi:glycerol-3-phosphate acyltransferase [Pseudothermotoga thermarum]|uniref:Glycerol-3-phosphate acyltransferase n=1 Tax=Pseudothermotoga thermarum DSM 5069 TaxID=688269 RepID=F7YXW2_9THEM|nr:glycerol-3-phosphate acyltransferase [Pseudothermotoga thermarum]AEH50761.1 protein of unknown function DUF205 [Pseudothermotoga thermarum DSM 5069]
MKSAFSILIGYLLGCFLPAYFFAKWFKKVDIRTLGDGNPGTTNVKRTLGLKFAVPTALYDTTKGILAMFIAEKIFHCQSLVVYLSGVAAIVGHVAPFYLKFKGGKGAATATGMLIIMLLRISRNIQPFALISTLAYLTFYVLSMFFATKDENFLALSTLPILAIVLIFLVPLLNETIFSLCLMGYLFFVGVKNMQKLKMFTIKSENLPLWRIFIRPAAMSFFVLSLVISKIALITLVGIVLACSFATDLIRLSHERVGKILNEEIAPRFRIYKQKEKHRISSITMFLLGVFLTYLLFSESIAIASLCFLVFGDMMAKIVGINYGRTMILKTSAGKTLEGWVGFLSISVSAAYFLWFAKILPLWIGLVGALVASIAESLPIPIDDNVSVPVLSGAVMMLLMNLG